MLFLKWDIQKSHLSLDIQTPPETFFKQIRSNVYCDIAILNKPWGWVYLTDIYYLLIQPINHPNVSVTKNITYTIHTYYLEYLCIFVHTFTSKDPISVWWNAPTLTTFHHHIPQKSKEHVHQVAPVANHECHVPGFELLHLAPVTTRVSHGMVAS